MVEISSLAEPDRDPWEALARGKDAYFGVDRADDDYERTWRRLLDGGQTRGAAARLDGAVVGIAHYVFHPSVWFPQGRCYLADLYVADGVRRRGVATAVIEWVARDGAENGHPALYWNTLQDIPARALYDKVGKLQDGMVVYTHRRDA
jgi:GNAT superfamily N-acetyltransferase